MKRPASQYYWGDWWKDKGLHSCSLAARGLWHEMNCLMHEGEPYGHLTLAGRPMTVAQLANQSRISTQQCTKLLRELEEAGVPSRSSDGVLFSRRMVRDEAYRNARAEGGKAGAEHGIKGAEYGARGGRPRIDKGASKTPLPPGGEPPPSSSASTASSSTPSGGQSPSGSLVKPPPNPAAKRARTDTSRAPDRPGDVDAQVWADWNALRRAKKAPVTETALTEAQREAEKAGMSLEAFLRIWCARGSQGLQAEWLRPQERAAARKLGATFVKTDYTIGLPV